MSTRLTVCSIVGNTQSVVLNTQLNRLKVAPNGRERSKEMGTQHCTVHYTLYCILHYTQVSRVTCQELGVTCSMLGVMCHMSPVICHMSLTRQQKQPRTLPLLTPPVYINRMLLLFLTYSHRKFETNVISLFFPKESFCNNSILFSFLCK